MECRILARGDFAIGVEGFKATLFFLITLKPDLVIGMRVSKSLEKGRWTFLVEIKSADK